MLEYNVEKKEEILEEKSSASKDSLVILHFGPEIICCFNCLIIKEVQDQCPVVCSAQKEFSFLIVCI